MPSAANKLIKKLKSNLPYLVFLSIFTFLVAEISCLFLNVINESKKSQSEKIVKEAGLQFSNKNKDINYERTIFSMKPNLKREKISYRTDSIGSIIPSNFDSIGSNQKYILFCGGSTTESSQVNEGKRTTDLFSIKSKEFKAVNLSRAGKGLQGCMITIDNFQKNLKEKDLKKRRPSLYIIATNINTLSDFLRADYANKNKSIFVKYPFGSNLINLIKFNLTRLQRNRKLNIKITEYEHAVLEGCCFAPSNINNPKDLPKEVNWNDNKLKLTYEKYLDNQYQSLKLTLKKHQIKISDVVFLIEPNSYELDYQSLFRDYWKGYDGRQLLFDFEGKNISHESSNKIISIFDGIYLKKAEENGFLVLNPKSYNFPKWSFYDAVHFTDYGSEHMSEYLLDKLIK